MNKKNTKTRQELQLDGFLDDGFVFKNVKYKSPSLRSVRLLEKLETVLPSESVLDGVLRTLFVLSRDWKDIKQDIDSGNIEEILLDYADSFNMEDLEKVSEYLTRQKEQTSANEFEVVQTADDISEKK